MNSEAQQRLAVLQRFTELGAGNQLDAMNADAKGVLTNSEVIAIDLDPLAKRATKVSDSNGLQVYSKVLSGTGRRTVLLLNRSSATATITVRFADIGLGTTVSVRDVWVATDLGKKTSSYGTSVASYDSVLLLVTDGAAQQPPLATIVIIRGAMDAGGAARRN
jgi:hypothetical protein